MRKCGFCRKPNKKLSMCIIVKEGLHGYRADLDFWEVQKLICLYLCDECVNKNYILKHTQKIYLPTIIKENYFEGVQ